MAWRFLFSFHGRMRRSHWWLVRLMAWAPIVVLLAATGTLGILVGSGEDAAISALFHSPLLLALLPVPFWIDVASSVKRLHDTDITGWAYLLLFIPYIGGLGAFVVMGCLDGTRGPNKFGPSPKHAGLTHAMIFE